MQYTVLQMPVQIQASFMNATETESGILGVKITADSPTPRPIHIALVMDTSGSMEGTRINGVKKTLAILTERLLVGDILTIVGFSSSSKTYLSNFTITEDNRETASLIIAELEASGGTNIESGICELGRVLGTTSPDSVVLLTDGYVNEGITSVAGISSLLKSYIPGVPVYSLGYGDHHNADFMKGLSSRTNGTYTFINNEIALPASIGELLGSLQGEVGKNAMVNFPPSWSCLELNSVSGANVYGAGSLIADKPTWIMFRVEQLEGVTTLEYKDMSGSIVTIPFVVNTSLPSLDVEEQYLRCLTAVALNKATECIQNEKLVDAKNLLVDMLNKITNSLAVTRPLAIRMKARVEEMMEELKIALTAPSGLNLVNLALRTGGAATQYMQQRGVSVHGDVEEFNSPGVAIQTAHMVSQYTQ